MIWIGGRRMKRCRHYGNTFAFNHYAEWYCSSPVCQASKAKRTLKSTQPARTVVGERRGVELAAHASGRECQPVSSAGRRAAELDAKAALIELRAWAAQERAKW
jgi:hypothetical protein